MHEVGWSEHADLKTMAYCGLIGKLVKRGAEMDNASMYVCFYN